MGYSRRYLEGTREENDAAAIKDIKEYLSEVQWEAMMQAVGACTQGAPGWDFQRINICLGFTGIEGYPVHAFGRKYCLKQYIEWMRSDKCGGPIEVDEQGFTANND